MVNVLRLWLHDDERAASVLNDGESGQSESDPPLFVSSDLRNAYGLVKRSALLQGVRLKAPRLARLLATKWCDGINTVYHRIRMPGANHCMWEEPTAERGGGQGGRLMMLAFCCSLACTLELATVEAASAGKAAAKTAASAKNMGYQDDQYIRSGMRSCPHFEPVPLAALEADGREPQRTKSKVWIPLLDDVEDHAAPADDRGLWARCGRARYGLVALGSSAQGQAETLLEWGGTVALAPVVKRAARTADVIAATLDMAEQQRHPQALHAAWTLLLSSQAHALDYDARLVGAVRLDPVVGPVCRQL